MAPDAQSAVQFILMAGRRIAFKPDHRLGGGIVCRISLPSCVILGEHDHIGYGGTREKDTHRPPHLKLTQASRLYCVAVAVQRRHQGEKDDPRPRDATPDGIRRLNLRLLEKHPSRAQYQLPNK